MAVAARLSVKRVLGALKGPPPTPLVVAGLFQGYLAYNTARKALAVAAPGLASDAGLSKTDLGLVSSSFTAMYGASKFAGSVITDHCSCRVLFSVGLLLTGVLCLAFSVGSHDLPRFCLLWSMHGVVQGAGWPSLAKICVDRVPPRLQGRVWALLTAAGNVGQVIAGPMLLGLGGGWRRVLRGAGALALLAGVVSWFTTGDMLEDDMFLSIPPSIPPPTPTPSSPPTSSSQAAATSSPSIVNTPSAPSAAALASSSTPSPRTLNTYTTKPLDTRQINSSSGGVGGNGGSEGSGTSSEVGRRRWVLGRPAEEPSEQQQQQQQLNTGVLLHTTEPQVPDGGVVVGEAGQPQKRRNLILQLLMAAFPGLARQLRSLFLTIIEWISLVRAVLRPDVAALLGADALVYFVIKGLADWSVLVLTETKGLREKEAVGVFFYCELGAVIGSFLSGYVSDQLGGLRTTTSSFFAIAALPLLYATDRIPAMISLPGVLGPDMARRLESFRFAPLAAAYFLLGLCVNGPRTLSGIALRQMVPPNMAGTATGVQGLIGQVGASWAGAPVGFVAQYWGWGAIRHLWALSVVAASGLLMVPGIVDHNTPPVQPHAHHTHPPPTTDTQPPPQPPPPPEKAKAE